MADLALITSLYRSDAHLPAYVQAVRAVAQRLHAGGIRAEWVAVVNDATETERHLLAELSEQFGDTGYLQVLFVPRESLYASWNRGVQAANAPLMGPWNVDDVRYADALIEAVGLFRKGVEIIDSPFINVILEPEREIREWIRTPYRQDVVTPRRGVGPFFLFSRTLYDKAGPFNAHYRITGDFEWATRPEVRHARYAATEADGGEFVRHAASLSGGMNPLEWIEFNTTLIWRDELSQIRPVHPEKMQEAWQSWGRLGGQMNPELAEWLWGPAAPTRYERYQQWRSQPALLRRIRQALAARRLLPDPVAAFQYLSS